VRAVSPVCAREQGRRRPSAGLARLRVRATPRLSLPRSPASASSGNPPAQWGSAPAHRVHALVLSRTSAPTHAVARGAAMRRRAPKPNADDGVAPVDPPQSRPAGRWRGRPGQAAGAASAEARGRRRAWPQWPRRRSGAGAPPGLGGGAFAGSAARRRGEEPRGAGARSGGPEQAGGLRPANQNEAASSSGDPHQRPRPCWNDARAAGFPVAIRRARGAQATDAVSAGSRPSAAPTIRATSRPNVAGALDAQPRRSGWAA
jgi:hypothetical protein